MLTRAVWVPVSECILRFGRVGDKLRSVRCSPEQLAPQRAVLDNCPVSAPTDTFAQNCHDQPTLSQPAAARTGTGPAATTTCADRNQTCHTPLSPVAAQPLQEHGTFSSAMLSRKQFGRQLSFDHVPLSANQM